jgi:nitrous oxide reductase accessory protein NosL
VPADGVSLQEFYDRTWTKGEDLRFALGSDVTGPMGADVVPVAPERAAKFTNDHHASRVVELGELTLPVLQALP